MHEHGSARGAGAGVQRPAREWGGGGAARAALRARTMMPGCLGRPTMEGKTARGASSPAKPALHMPDPLSTTSACTSSLYRKRTGGVRGGTCALAGGLRNAPAKGSVKAEGRAVQSRRSSSRLEALRHGALTDNAPSWVACCSLCAAARLPPNHTHHLPLGGWSGRAYAYFPPLPARMVRVLGGQRPTLARHYA